MKKLFIRMMVLTIILSSTNTIVKAEEGPSYWALEEVEEAISEEIVPTILQVDYRENIKRYEYALLALELLKLKNDKMSITTKYPFTDIYGHEFEDEIVQAFNAGIIKGNGNGTFRPNDLITREEVASLIVNLVKKIDYVDEVESTANVIFSDENQFSFWSKAYVNYCYNKKIMNGVGGDRIDPLGKATREQAIILLYRLANTKHLLSNVDIGTIAVYRNKGASLEKVQSTKINDFANVFGQETAKRLIKLSKSDHVKITGLDKDYAVVNFVDEGKIIISNDGYTIRASLEVDTPVDSDIIQEFEEITEQISGHTLLKDALNRDLNILVNNKAHESDLTLSEKETYSSYSEQRDEIIYYVFTYLLTK